MTGVRLVRVLLPATLLALAVLLPLAARTALAADGSADSDNQPRREVPHVVTDENVATLPGVRRDFPPPTAAEYGRTDVTPFIDAGYVIYTRTVGFADAPDEVEGTFSPHVFFGVGLWVGEPDGLGEVPDLLSSFGQPFGVRVGVTIGGEFAFRNRSLDVNVDSVDDFANFVLELEILGPWWSWGVGPDLVLSQWEFAGFNDRDLEFRGTVIPAGGKIVQSITQYAAGLPVPLIDSWDWTLGGQSVPTLFGLYFKYEFLELGVHADSPAVRGIVSSHVLSAGVWVDWGIARFLRLHLRISAGGIAGHGEAFVAELAGGITFTHIPPHWADGRLEFLASFFVDLTTHGFGGRYLHEAGNARLGRSTVAWMSLQFRMGLRLLF